MIYAVSFMVQEPEIKAYCFNSCGRISIGGIDMGEWGPFLPCQHEDCEFEANRTPVLGEAFGEDVCVRKLKEVKP